MPTKPKLDSDQFQLSGMVLKTSSHFPRWKETECRATICLLSEDGSSNLVSDFPVPSHLLKSLKIGTAVEVTIRIVSDTKPI